ncbi:25240_t:CDS:2, partial [Racocetra persica]
PLVICRVPERRFFELCGKTLYLFRDETEKLPISKLELDGQVTGVTDAQSEVLIFNSFKVDFRSSELYYFFSDDKKNKELIVAAIDKHYILDYILCARPIHLSGTSTDLVQIDWNHLEDDLPFTPVVCYESLTNVSILMEFRVFSIYEGVSYAAGL